MQLATLKGVTPPKIDEGAAESEGQEDPALGPAKLETVAETAADKVSNKRLRLKQSALGLAWHWVVSMPTADKLSCLVAVLTM